MPVGSQLRGVLPGQRQKVSHHHSRVGFQMDSHPLPLLATSDALQRGKVHENPPTERVHFCHPSPGEKIIKKLWTGPLRGLAAAPNAMARVNRFNATCAVERAASPDGYRGSRSGPWATSCAVVAD